jgi:hypothetical protein
MKGKALVLGSTVATAMLLVLPSAFAGTTYPDVFERAAAAHAAVQVAQQDGSYPDAFERAVEARRTTVSSPGGSIPDAFERALNNALTAGPVRPDDSNAARGPGVLAAGVAASSSIETSEGFQWADAAVGAGGASALLMLGAALLMTARHRGRALPS